LKIFNLADSLKTWLHDNEFTLTMAFFRDVIIFTVVIRHQLRLRLHVRVPTMQGAAGPGFWISG